MIDDILARVESGTLTAAEAKEKLASYEDLGFVKIDHHRHKRQGVPEIIFGEGKTAEQILAIIKSLKGRGHEVLATRVSEEKAAFILNELPDLSYNEIAQTLSFVTKKPSGEGFIAIICAGTSDLPVAEEAAVTAETLGVPVRRFYDVGVAGLHRLLDHISEIREAAVSVCVAGMEGALPSVLGGLVENPIIAVPTSIGYGANFNGLSALLSMLNSCASGVSVVNIDNGFGAAYNAVLIHRLAYNNKGETT
ncbi:nickel pincer cofactor biosynthesis protein LarB [Domibacillus indicus]|uniref:nickel pincer cofactor biosynthesis protein LarB n=1 Tax=Domibacillus indicus TaxID=1437523 RepID=UPI0020421CE2|nr:nickel pincer cofactor biosynthesis protein LarB [Domibacillus indicus]MCM3790094.1 nickel pincer cofactor biosynthesis protein LarB [Domibacillus indicus]